MESFIDSTIRDGVATVTLNRPQKRNALTREMIVAITSTLDALAAQAMRALVLRAEGPVFCAGMDLGQMQQRAESADADDEWRRDADTYCELLCRLYSLDVPTIAAVQGPALAGGVGLVLACDLVVAAQNAFFSLPEPVRGITAAMVTPLLAHRIGYGPAGALLLSGERLLAKRAAELGLVYFVADEDELAARVDQLTHALLTGSPAALSITKQHLDQCAGGQLRQQLKRSAEVSATARESADAREGLQAFLEKRKPSWFPQG